MAEIYSRAVSESDDSQRCDSVSLTARRRRMEIRRSKFISSMQSQVTNRQQMKRRRRVLTNGSDGEQIPPKFTFTSVCGRRRHMEDAVAIHPSFCKTGNKRIVDLHYFGVYDGHGCSHVAMMCRDRLHELVKEELKNEAEPKDWKKVMERSYDRMDKEAIECNIGVDSGIRCRCKFMARHTAGSTSVVSVVTPDKIIVANSGDSRAVLCRNGRAIPLSSDHKPDRPDELSRIEAAGGSVVYWDGARVFGVLAMSRAIGDNFLKPYVICEPEVTIIDRTDEDEFLILASDGLWDMMSNEIACSIVRMYLKGKGLPGSSPESSTSAGVVDPECDVSMLLTQIALSRLSSDNVSVVIVDLRKEN